MKRFLLLAIFSLFLSACGDRLSAEQISKMTEEQLKQVTPEQMGKMTPGELQVFNERKDFFIEQQSKAVLDKFMARAKAAGL